MNKWKITYRDYDRVKAIIFRTDLFDMNKDIINSGISPNEVIKIELVLEADPENIKDISD